jgi:hypothetical protein
MKGEYIMVNSRKEEMKGTEKDKKEKKSVQKKTIVAAWVLGGIISISKTNSTKRHY